QPSTPAILRNPPTGAHNGCFGASVRLGASAPFISRFPHHPPQIEGRPSPGGCCAQSRNASMSKYFLKRSASPGGITIRPADIARGTRPLGSVWDTGLLEAYR